MAPSHRLPLPHAMKARSSAFAMQRHFAKTAACFCCASASHGRRIAPGTVHSRRHSARRHAASRSATSQRDHKGKKPCGNGCARSVQRTILAALDAVGVAGGTGGGAAAGGGGHAVHATLEPAVCPRASRTHAPHATNARSGRTQQTHVRHDRPACHPTSDRGGVRAASERRSARLGR